MDARVQNPETWVIVRRHHDHFRIRSSVEVSHDDNMILPATVPLDTLVSISTGCNSTTTRTSRGDFF